RAALALPRALLERAEQADLVSGLAGLLLALGALADHSDADLREPMRVCGERLLALAVAQPVGIGWPPLAGGAPLCSMAHGNAGIALALVEAWQRSGEASLLEGARAALDYEHAAFDEVRGAWPDLRAPDAPPMSTWCHGAPGIALSRARVLQLDDRPSSRQDLARALAVTRAAALRAPHLCCGRAGLSEILRELGAGAEGSTKTTDGWQDLPAAGLMIGLSGVGYGLLARSLPAPRLPSVLRLGS
ncbi:MAG: hypothetical protein KC503_31940, partial [Myxococcales bacterium]|nr:hypothetical protein [Myxococcales bacterium]